MTSQTSPDQTRNQGVRELDGQIRAVGDDAEGRSFTLSFSSEEPYKRWFGLEILDHKAGAVNMSRLDSLGVVLFNHDRDRVLGKISRAWIENGRGQAEIEFDRDAASEEIYQKVRSGTLRGVSVGYRVDDWEDVSEGHKSADGRFTGPCAIARHWTPFEVSIVSVPADPTVGVGRDMEPEPDAQRGESPDLSYTETRKRQLIYNQNLWR